MNKLEVENRIFDMAIKRLNSIYGPFERINEQTDRPDAAIKLVSKPTQIIGIEITSADKTEDKQYFNDRKHSRSIESEQIDAYLNDGTISQQPIKLASISFDHDYIFEGIKSKAEKFETYNKEAKYKEVILLVTSDFLSPKYEFFYDYIVPWTRYLLSRIEYPFRRVIFVSTDTPDGVVIYDSKKKCKAKPRLDKSKEVGVTSLQSSFRPFGVPVNINNMFDLDPIVKRKAKR